MPLLAAAMLCAGVDAPHRSQRSMERARKSNFWRRSSALSWGWSWGLIWWKWQRRHAMPCHCHMQPRVRHRTVGSGKGIGRILAFVCSGPRSARLWLGSFALASKCVVVSSSRAIAEADPCYYVARAPSTKLLPLPASRAPHTALALRARLLTAQFEFNHTACALFIYYIAWFCWLVIIFILTVDIDIFFFF
jgi:hypothetical protein